MHRTSIGAIVATLVALGAPSAPAATPQADAETPTWSSFGVSPHPDGRQYHHMVAAPEIGKLIVFGGDTQHGIDDDLWVLDVANPADAWTRIEPTGTAPAVREFGSTIWDPVGRQMVLFGGLSSELISGLPVPTFYNDVWAVRFDATGTTGEWVRLHEGGAVDDAHPLNAIVPAPRADHVAVYDPVGRRMIVHGGIDVTTLFAPSLTIADYPQWRITGRKLVRYAFGDAWSFDLANGAWTQLSDAGPERYMHQAAFDPVNRQLVVTSGYGPGATPEDGFSRDDSWSLSPSTGAWTRWEPAGISPALRDAAYDYSADLGGLLAMSMNRRDDPTDPRRVYLLRFGPGGAGAEWTALPNTTNPRRALFGMRGVVFPGPERFLVMGGFLGGDGDPVDWKLWSYDVGSGAWSRPLKGIDPLPAARAAQATVLPNEGSMHVLGRQYTEQAKPWRLPLATGKWEPVRARAGAPDSGVPIHDPANRRLLVLEGCMDRVWTLAEGGDEWRELDARGDVPPICGPRAVFDPVRERLVVFGGIVEGPDGSFSIQNKDAFALELAPEREAPGWHELKPGGTFRFPSSESAVFDTIGDRAIFTAQDDRLTWSLDFSTSREGEWREIPATGQTPSSSLSPRAFDPVGNRVLAYNGCVDGKMWVLDLAGAPAWSELQTVADPPKHCETAGAFDPVGRRFLIYGGTAVDPFGYTNETSDSFALSLGAGTSPGDEPADPGSDAPPEPGAVVGGTWQRWGPDHAFVQDVDMAPGFAVTGAALLATTSLTAIPPRGAGVYRIDRLAESWAPSEGAATGIAMTELAFAPSDPSKVYAASMASRSRGAKYGLGMYTSDDGGATWSAASRGLPRDSYWAVAAHPDDPQTAWAAGERGGVYRTSDGGGTWDEVSENTFDGLWVNALAVAHIPGGVRVFAGVRLAESPVAGEGGVYYSDDGGSSWRLGFQTEQFVKALAVDPSDERRVIAAEGYGVWRSEDSGATWEHVNGNTWQEPTGDDVHLGAVEFDPSSGGQVLYGGGLPWACDFKDGLQGGPASPPFTPQVFRSEDGGATWTAIEELPLDLWCGMAVSPDGRTVMASGQYSGLWRSDDAGQTWTLTGGVTQLRVMSVAPHPTNPLIAIAALGRDGVMRTTDGGRSWEQTLEQAGEDAFAFAVTAARAKPGRFVAVMNGQAWVTEDSGATWESRSGNVSGGYEGFPAPPLIDPNDADTWYFDTVGPSGGRGLGISHDNGRTSEVHTVSGGGAGAGCPAHFAISPPSRIWVGDRCGDGVFRSDDGGTTWRLVSEEVADGYVTSLAVNPSDPSEVWMATEHRGVFRSGDGGETWQSARMPDLGYKEVRSLVVSPTQPERVFASAIDFGIYETNDDGATWTKLTDGIPTRAPLGLQADPAGRIFAGSWTGGVLVLG